MASYQVKSQRTLISVRSPYTRKIRYSAELTEYSVSHSPDDAENSPTEKPSSRIEDETPSLFWERQLCLTRDEIETSMGKTIPDLGDLSLGQNTELPAQPHGDDDEEAEEEGGMSEVPDEILMTLLKYVHGMDRVNLGSTCKRFRHLLLQSGLLWKSRRVSWDIDSHRYAVLAPQIEKLVIIVLSACERLEDFCLDLFSKERSYANIINIIKPEIDGEDHSLVCWIRSSDRYQKYEIFPHTGRLNSMLTE